jgi:hypothetical protein
MNTGPFYRFWWHSVVPSRCYGAKKQLFTKNPVNSSCGIIKNHYICSEKLIPM